MEEIYDNTVLIVDDEIVLRQLLVDHVADQVSNVHSASNGDEALQLVKKIEFDLAIVDIKMPGMDGITLIQQIKEISPDTICVILTGYGDKDQLKQAFHIGAYDFLDKPCPPHILDNALKRCLDLANLEKVKREMLELLLYHYCDVDHESFKALSKTEQRRTLVGTLGLMKMKILNKKLEQK